MTYTHTNATFSQNLSEAENHFLQHIQMFGSSAYPIHKVGNGKWLWNEFWGVKGAPTVYRTKRAAAEAIERYIDVLIDKVAGRIE